VSKRIDYSVKMGSALIVDKDSVLKVFGVSSCVIVYLFNENLNRAAVLHAVYPKSYDNLKAKKNPYRYVYEGLNKLIKDFYPQYGVRLKAKVIGGASLIKSYKGFIDIGKKNYECALDVLGKHNVEVVAVDIGGDRSRNIWIYYPEHKVKIEYFGGGERWI